MTQLLPSLMAILEASLNRTATQANRLNLKMNSHSALIGYTD